jgi:hypothetical protein
MATSSDVQAGEVLDGRPAAAPAEHLERDHREHQRDCGSDAASSVGPSPAAAAP